MISAKELRIGNWVLFTDFPAYNNPVQLKEGYLKQQWLDSFAKPIPLTTEILERCGFDRNCILKISQRLNIEWSYGKEVWLTKEGEVIYEFENTQHLHQLQNLYFALTGEELNYTP